MIRDDIIRMAETCGIPEFENNESQANNILRFAAFVAAAEREECAKVCEAQRSIEWMTASIARVNHEPANIMADSCAAAIRARGEK